jgi:hypothetical protein
MIIKVSENKPNLPDAIKITYSSGQVQVFKIKK